MCAIGWVSRWPDAHGSFNMVPGGPVDGRMHMGSFNMVPSAGWASRHHTGFRWYSVDVNASGGPSGGPVDDDTPGGGPVDGNASVMPSGGPVDGRMHMAHSTWCRVGQPTSHGI